MWSLPTFCGLCFTEEPHTSALWKQVWCQGGQTFVIIGRAKFVPLRSRHNILFQLSKNVLVDAHAKVLDGAFARPQDDWLLVVGQLSLGLGVSGGWEGEGKT